MSPVDLMHICFGGVGGVRSMVNELTEQLNGAGLTTGVVPIGRSEDLAEGPAAWPGAAVVTPIVLQHRADLGSMVGVLLAARRMRARAVLVHSPRHALPAYLGRRLARLSPRLVSVLHASVNDRSQSLDINSASSLACSRAVVFLTAENKSGYPLRHLPLPALDNCFVIPNGVSLADFAGVARSVRAPEAELRVGMAARLVPLKDVDTLIGALAIIQRTKRDASVRLVIAGDGSELPRLRDVARDLGVDSMIDFLGSISESRIPSFLAGLDAYVQSTHGETLSMSLLQAAAARVPIVASDVAGVHDVFVQGVHARLTSPRDAEALAEGIVEVLTDHRLAERLTDNAYAMVAARYTSAHMAIAYLEMLHGIDADGPWAAAARRLGGGEAR